MKKPLIWCSVCGLVIRTDETPTPKHAPDNVRLSGGIRHENPYVCIERLKEVLNCLD